MATKIYGCSDDLVEIVGDISDEIGCHGTDDKERARIRSAAIGDMLGDSKALDEMGPAAMVFRLCRELELARKYAVTVSEVAAAAWGGEIPSPLPGHTHMTEEEFSESYNCPWCGGSGHVDDCDEIQIKLLRERDEARGQIVQLYSALNLLVSFADNQICRHEETHRGGLIWEICDFCGAKWADDEGGKPEFVEPKEIKNAYRVLGEIEKSLGE